MSNSSQSVEVMYTIDTINASIHIYVPYHVLCHMILMMYETIALLHQFTGGGSIYRHSVLPLWWLLSSGHGMILVHLITWKWPKLTLAQPEYVVTPLGGIKGQTNIGTDTLKSAAGCSDGPKCRWASGKVYVSSKAKGTSPAISRLYRSPQE